MRPVDPWAPEEVRFRRRFVIATLALGLVFAVLFFVFPELDLAVSEALRLCPEAEFAAPWCAVSPVAKFLRQAFIALSLVIVAITLAGIALATWRHRALIGLDQARWWFIVATLAVGNGLVANVIFKDNWGRARPRQVVEFGGPSQFTPPLLPVGECVRNCSFVSGEASSAYAPFFAAALVFPQARVALLAGGIAVGTVAGLVRISQGAHFLSDVLFAGIFMALTASLLHVLMIGLWRARYGRPDHSAAITTGSAADD